MTYEVFYKSKWSLFFNKISKVKGDFLAKEIPSCPRVLILEDESRIELPTSDMIFKFSKERFIVIKQNMEKESGNKIII